MARRKVQFPVEKVGRRIWKAFWGQRYDRQKYLDYIRYDPKWEKKRKSRLKMDCNRCRVCNSQYNLQVHHRTYDNLYNENVSEDLTTLCNGCHKLFHDNRRLTKY